MNNIAKKRKRGLPTTDEQIQIQQTDALFRSNITRLQIVEMLEEVRLRDDKTIRSLNDWVKRFGSALDRVTFDADTYFRASDLDETYKGLSFDLSKESPISIKLDGLSISHEHVGSIPLGTTVLPDLNVDIVISMPDCVEYKDIRSGIYSIKRKLFLIALYNVISASGFGDSLIEPNSCRLSAFKGDVSKPILEFVPLLPQSRKLPKGIRVRLLLTAKSDVLVKLKSLDTGDVVRTSNTMTAVEDVVIQTQFRLLSKIFSSFPSARDAVLLFKIWLTQRSMRYGPDSFDGHCASLFVAYLFQTKRVASKASALDVFQAALGMISSEDFMKMSFSFGSSHTDNCPAVLNSTPRLHLPLSFLLARDEKGDEMQIFDCFWRISLSGWMQLREEASHSLKLLQLGNSDAFLEVFMRQRTFFQRYDLFFRLPEIDVTQSLAPLSLVSVNAIGNFLDTLQQTMTTALPIGDRVLALHTHAYVENDLASVHKFSWSLSETARPILEYRVVIGVILNSEKSRRRVDRGPEASASSVVEGQAQPSAFAEFWGSRCQLRRFQDGSIVEAVIWGEQSGPEVAGSTLHPQGESIIEEIARFVIENHFSGIVKNGDSKVVCSRLVDEHIFLAPSFARGYPSVIYDPDTLCRHAIEAFDSLRGLLTSASCIPLAIESVVGVSPSLRYTSLMAPLKHPFAMEADAMKSELKALRGRPVSLVVEPLILLVTLESSAQWPSDKLASENLICSFLIRIAESFNMKAIPARGFLDVFYSGYAFRLIVRAKHFSESDSPVIVKGIRYDDIPLAIRSDGEVGDTMILHHQRVRALHSIFPSYARAVRLFLGWLASRSLSNALSHETVELLVASVYLHSDRFHPPTSSTSGFLQSLRRLVLWEWENMPLVVAFDNQLSSAFEKDVHGIFNRRKETSMFIVAVYSKTCVTYPSSSVISRSLLRMLRLDASSIIALANVGCEINESSVSKVDSSRFDVIFRIRRSLLPASYARAHSVGGSIALSTDAAEGPLVANIKAFANLHSRALDVRNLIIRESPKPNCIVGDLVPRLQKSFGKYALFFWNAVIGDELKILWIPAMFVGKPLTVLETDDKVVLSQEELNCSFTSVSCVVAAILEMCEGLVEEIVFN